MSTILTDGWLDYVVSSFGLVHLPSGGVHFTDWPLHGGGYFKLQLFKVLFALGFMHVLKFNLKVFIYIYLYVYLLPVINIRNKSTYKASMVICQMTP